MDETKSSKVKIEWFRIITPVLVTINLFVLGAMFTLVNDIDNKLFTHLTNEDIHVPRGYNVSQAEFDMYAKFANQERAQVLKAIEKLSDKIK